MNGYNKYINLSTFFLFFYFNSLGQDSYFSKFAPIENNKIKLNDTSFMTKSIPQLLQNQLDYISPLRFLAQLENVKDKFTAPQLNFYLTQLTTNLSFVGQYANAAIIYDSFQSNQNSKYIPNKTDSLYVNNFLLKDAISIINIAAANSRLILVSESHHMPSHRIFTYSLLKSLYKQGFRYLALEDLINLTCTSINEKVTSKMGYYIVEPNYANLVRYALSLGYHLVSYDCKSCLDLQEREDKAAAAINLLLEKNRNAKILVHCGYGHASKSQVGTIKMLGNVLKYRYNLNPISISQTVFSEGSSFTFKSAVYQLLKNKFKFNTPQIIYNDEQPLDIYGDSSYNYIVVTPLYNEFSDSYLRLNTNLVKVKIAINKTILKRGILLQTYPVAETKKDSDFLSVIPTSNFLLTNDVTIPINVLLPRGNYFLVVRNSKNKIISKQKLSIK